MRGSVQSTYGNRLIAFDFDVLAEVARERTPFMLDVLNRLHIRGYQDASLEHIRAVFNRHPDLLIKALCSFDEAEDDNLDVLQSLEPEDESCQQSYQQSSAFVEVHKFLATQEFNQSPEYNQSIPITKSAGYSNNSCRVEEQDHDGINTNLMKSEGNEDSASLVVGNELGKRDIKLEEESLADPLLAESTNGYADQSEQYIPSATEFDLSEELDQSIPIIESAGSSNNSYQADEHDRESINTNVMTVEGNEDSASMDDGNVLGKSVSNFEDESLADPLLAESTNGYADQSEQFIPSAAEFELSQELDQSIPIIESSVSLISPCRLDDHAHGDLNTYFVDSEFHEDSTCPVVADDVGSRDSKLCLVDPALMEPANCYADQPKPSISNRIPIIVLKFNDPNEIIAQRLDLDLTCSQVEEKLASWFDQVAVDEKFQCSPVNVQIGTPVVFTDDGLHYRAVITNVPNDKEVGIRLVDRGFDINDVMFEKLLLLSVAHAIAPLSCKLTLNVDINKKWDESALSIMSKICMDKWRNANFLPSGEMDMRMRGYLCGDLATTDMFSLSLKNELNLHLSRVPVLGLHSIIAESSGQIEQPGDINISTETSMKRQGEKVASEYDEQEMKSPAPLLVEDFSGQNEKRTRTSSVSSSNKTRSFAFMKSKAARPVEGEKKEKRRDLLLNTFPTYYKK